MDEGADANTVLRPPMASTPKAMLHIYIKLSNVFLEMSSVARKYFGSLVRVLYSLREQKSFWCGTLHWQYWFASYHSLSCSRSWTPWKPKCLLIRVIDRFTWPLLDFDYRWIKCMNASDSGESSILSTNGSGVYSYSRSLLRALCLRNTRLSTCAKT